MKRRISVFLLLSLLLLASGCRDHSSTDEPELTPVTETVTVGDFEIQATAAGTVCPRRALGKVTYTVEIRYIGNEPEVTLFGGNRLFYVRPDPKPSRWNLVLTDEGYYYTLKPGEILTQTMSSLNPKLLPKGSFTMDVIVDFCAGPTPQYEKNPQFFPQSAEKYSHTFQFPLTVK